MCSINALLHMTKAINSLKLIVPNLLTVGSLVRLPFSNPRFMHILVIVLSRVKFFSVTCPFSFRGHERNLITIG
jgi:hypothetical protein